ncbi:MbnP family protein [Dyadobacter sp. 3J3]|uniref:MbnP family protein n=1 Tax=Dyadobacter sp. 3J3 TaxID=2606600 RepID=UPI001E390328|nr:MbnP family protein [Dyadobacter sp. 3J3]
MKKLIYILSLATFSLCILAACNDDKESTEPEPVQVEGDGKLRLKFDNVVGNQDLVLNDAVYKNSVGEDFTVTKFNYFVTNIKLLRADGTQYIIPQDSSYFRVVEQDSLSRTITLNRIPKGSYTGVEYILGVDSLRSVSGIEKRGGALDPSGDMAGDGMYWAWSSGYIFLKFEGYSSQSTSANGKFYYHIGFFGGYDSKTVNNIKTIKLDFAGNKAVVGKDTIPEIGIIADVKKVFDGPVPLSIEKHPSIMFDFIFSAEVANNYKNMFRIDKINSVSK